LLQHFDKDKSGFITREELRSALQAHSLDDKELTLDVQDVLHNTDQDHDGKIDYFEFCNMMMAGNAGGDAGTGGGEGGVLRQLSQAVERDIKSHNSDQQQQQQQQLANGLRS
jgi:hypothetical protein